MLYYFEDYRRKESLRKFMNAYQHQYPGAVKR